MHTRAHAHAHLLLQAGEPRRPPNKHPSSEESGNAAHAHRDEGQGDSGPSEHGSAAHAQPPVCPQ
eukprot:7974111-Alexandrium_andersonii.AAC.1